MKKVIALLATLAVALSLAVVPAWAESSFFQLTRSFVRCSIENGNGSNLAADSYRDTGSEITLSKFSMYSKFTAPMYFQFSVVSPVTAYYDISLTCNTSMFYSSGPPYLPDSKRETVYCRLLSPNDDMTSSSSKSSFSVNPDNGTCNGTLLFQANTKYYLTVQISLSHGSQSTYSFVGTCSYPTITLADHPANAGITPPTSFKCAKCGRSVTYDEAQRLSWQASFSDAECEKWPDLAAMNGKYYWVCIKGNGGCDYTDNPFTYGWSVGNQATYEPGKTTVVQPDGTTINNIITVNPSTGTPVVNVTVIEPSPCSHTYDAGTREEPTCTTPGKLTQTCTKCGDVKVTTLETVPHKYDEGATLEPTCVTSGKLTQTCTVCSDIKVTVLPALGHDWAAKKTVTTQYDDTGAVVQQGYVLYECTRCQEQYKSETIDGETKPPPGGGGSSGGGGSGSGSGDGGGSGSGDSDKKTIWERLGDFLGTILGGALDVIGAAVGKILDILTQVVQNLVEGVKNLVTGLLDVFTTLLDFGGGFRDFLASFFSWIPPEISALLVLSVSLGICLMIIKFFRG